MDHMEAAETKKAADEEKGDDLSAFKEGPIRQTLVDIVKSSDEEMSPEKPDNQLGDLTITQAPSSLFESDGGKDEAKNADEKAGKETKAEKTFVKDKEQAKTKAAVKSKSKEKEQEKAEEKEENAAKRKARARAKEKKETKPEEKEKPKVDAAPEAKQKENFKAKEKARCKREKEAESKDAEKEEDHDKKEEAADETKEAEKKRKPTQCSPMKMAANAVKRVVAKQLAGAPGDSVKKSLAEEFEKLAKKKEEGEGKKRKKAKALELSSVDTLQNCSANLHTSNVWSKNIFNKRNNGIYFCVVVISMSQAFEYTTYLLLHIQRTSTWHACTCMLMKSNVHMHVQ